jgi:hypothetical protein
VLDMGSDEGDQPEPDHQNPVIHHHNSQLTAHVVNDLPGPHTPCANARRTLAIIVTLSNISTVARKLTKFVSPGPRFQTQRLPRGGTQQTRGTGEH